MLTITDETRKLIDDCREKLKNTKTTVMHDTNGNTTWTEWTEFDDAQRVGELYTFTAFVLGTVMLDNWPTVDTLFPQEFRDQAEELFELDCKLKTPIGQGD